MHRRTGKIAVVLAAAGLAVAGTTAVAQGHSDPRNDADSGFSARLTGFAEVPPVSTDASGTFTAVLDPREDKLHWKLDYRGFSSNVNQAHVHFGQAGVNGGVSVFLCSDLSDAPRGTQHCPDRSATLTGTADRDDVVGPAAQGIGPREFDEFATALKGGVTYANVHSEAFPNGEIRGQIAHDDDVKRADVR